MHPPPTITTSAVGFIAADVRVRGSWFRVQGSFSVLGSVCWVRGAVGWGRGSVCWVRGAVCWVRGSACWVRGSVCGTTYARGTRMVARRYRELACWQLANDLKRRVYAFI